MPQIITGTVASDHGDKTIVVASTVRKTHPLYGKQYSEGTRYMAHDATNQAKVGDIVQIIACRPYSKGKRFKLLKITARAGIKFEETDATADIPQEEVTGDSGQVTAKIKTLAKSPENGTSKK